jgi:hypothetical protein
VTGGEFLRRLKKLAKRNGVAFAFVPDEGKESHGRIYYGPAFTHDFLKHVTISLN